MFVALTEITLLASVEKVAAASSISSSEVVLKLVML